jgi:hypothetical protein
MKNNKKISGFAIRGRCVALRLAKSAKRWWKLGAGLKVYALRAVAAADHSA